jgi:hypothetical protein
MLLVAVKVDRSPIHGLGVFALEAISKGSEVWRFTEGFDLDLDVQALEMQPAHLRRVLFHYGYVDLRLGRFISAATTPVSSTIATRRTCGSTMRWTGMGWISQFATLPPVKN